MASRLWTFLTTDIEDLFSPNTVTGGVEAAKAILEFSKKLKENSAKVPELAKMLTPVSSLLDVLNSPLAEIVGAGLPFIAIATKLLTFYLEKTQKEPTLPQCVALVSQAAYLESLKDFLKQDDDLLNRIGQTAASDEIQQQIKKLEEIEISDEDAKKAVTCFHESRLAEIYGEVLLERLKQAGLTETEAKILTQRVTWNTHRYMILAWAESGDAVKHLAQPSFADWREEQEKYQSLENYLTEQIATKPLEPVFAEEFTFKDIYVPLKAKPVDKNGEVKEQATSFDLENWAKETLNHPNKQGQVLFIQGGPGRGKSVFCRMFADWGRKQLYPIWIPVLIRLRDIPKLQNSFRETLREAVNANFASDDGWLTDRNTRYLFFLDGFDELIIEGRNSSGLEQFLKQVGQFQKDSTGKDMGHRVIVTGRTLALQGVERQMPDNLERVRIEVMDEPLQQQWLSRWEKQVGTEKKNAFAEFWQDERCPTQVQELAREPLLLYLLAAMHRDDKLNLEVFEQTNETQAKLVIYEESVNWVLTEQRPQFLQNQITELDTENLRCILMEAGLCVVQSGGEYAKVKMIEERLDKDIVAAIEEVRTQAGENVLKNALAAFYLKPAAGDQDGGVEFFHKSFSEFLCAKRLQESLIAWTEPGRRGRGYNLKDEQLWEEIYDLLGYGGLTPEIVEYLMGVLRESEEFRPVQLFERLEDFYWRWSDGEFIDSPTETIPQRKCQKLQQHNIELGQRQVDVYTGLNVMILLFELHRYSQQQEELKDKLVFHPCGQLDDEGKPEDEFRLYRIIGYSLCVGKFSFVHTVRKFLYDVNLRGVYLVGVNLVATNLSGADLSDANLYSTYLRDTNLSGANLSGASLSNTNLIHTDFREANLTHARLTYADLSGADLSDTTLTRANLNGADLSDTTLNRANLNGADLTDSNLSRANLTDSNLSRANLSRANLSGANLSGADLTDANFSRANLSSANFSRADLSGANLSSAYLSRADLSGANLSGAYLSRADLTDAYLSRANLSSQTFGEVKWDENTNWENVRGLETAMNVPEALKHQLGLE